MVSLLAGIACLGVPAILQSVESAGHLYEIATFVAWLSAAIFVFGALASAVRSWRRGELLKNQTSLRDFAALRWEEFEAMVSETFQRRGYDVKEKGGSQPDGGIDLIATKGGRTFFVQCKQWRQRKVGVKSVRELLGVVVAENASKGFLVTTGEFTDEAIGFAEKSELVALVDGEALLKVIRLVNNAESKKAIPKGIVVATSEFQ